MTLIADVLLVSAALGAGFYCFVLARRLRRFTDLEKGMGGAVALLSVQVEDMKTALADAQKTAAESAGRLEDTTRRAEEIARRLELSMASAHGDAPDPGFGPSAGPGGRSVRRRRRGNAPAAAEELTA